MRSLIFFLLLAACAVLNTVWVSSYFVDFRNESWPRDGVYRFIKISGGSAYLLVEYTLPNPVIPPRTLTDWRFGVGVYFHTAGRDGAHTESYGWSLDLWCPAIVATVALLIVIIRRLRRARSRPRPFEVITGS